ncbi:Hypothetical protein FKW44_005936 [Caligus rogercresseyi]|uniref:Uncharacterized protein n=1 Tax=Caligus rogercresseyi TaxID=217165 RepID=A0A7T8KCL7_CALRO|nr:Hypothetical protein FKW44_005936 [Caligus rogercresseyi]
MEGDQIRSLPGIGSPQPPPLAADTLVCAARTAWNKVHSCDRPDVEAARDAAIALAEEWRYRLPRSHGMISPKNRCGFFFYFNIYLY